MSLAARSFLCTIRMGDVAHYTTIAFFAAASSPVHANPGDGELSALNYFTEAECQGVTISPSSRVIAKQTFAGADRPYFRPACWTPKGSI